MNNNRPQYITLVLRKSIEFQTYKYQHNNHKTIKLEVREVDNIKENKDIYDDVVTKEEIIEAIEEKNSKKLKMLLTQEEANKLKNELKNEES